MNRRTLLRGLGTAALAPALMATESTLVPFDVGASRIRLVVEDGPLALGAEGVQAWVRDCCEAVAAWYGRFPVHPLVVKVVPTPGDGVHGGRTWGGADPLIRIRVGGDATREAVYGDWVLVHELVHLAFPNVPSNQHWIEEGLSTYVEPWIRVRCGQITAEKAWLDLVDGLPKGQPAPGDRGLDHTSTWGRTYWGGALWCLVADVALREGGAADRGLREALVAILEAGGSMHVHWPLERTLRIGDEAVGGTGLTDTWRAMRDRPVTVDLDALWRRLGVARSGGTVRFDDTAPLAPIRRAIDGTSGHP